MKPNVELYSSVPVLQSLPSDAMQRQFRCYTGLIPVLYSVNSGVIIAACHHTEAITVRSTRTSAYISLLLS